MARDPRPASVNAGTPPTPGREVAAMRASRDHPGTDALRSVLFLDVDGVCNDRRFVAAHRWRGTYGMVDRDKVALVNDVARRTGCLVVVSSTWRRDEDFRRCLRRRGAAVRYHRDWRTPRLDDGEPLLRGREVEAWLTRNQVARYAIVDDEDDFMPGQRPFHVRTSYETGLLPMHVERLVGILDRHGPALSP